MLELLVIIFIVGLLGFAVARAMMPGPPRTKSNMRPNKIDDFDITTASEGRVIPEVFGTVRITPNIIWYGKLKDRAIKVQKQTAGYKYTMNVLYALCTGFDKLLKIYRSNEKQWEGDVSYDLATSDGTHSNAPMMPADNVGDGWIEPIGSKYTVPADTYTFTAINATTFSVSSTLHPTMPNLTVDVRYSYEFSTGQNLYTCIYSGPTPFEAGDYFTIAIEVNPDLPEVVYGKRARGKAGTNKKEIKSKTYVITGKCPYHNSEFENGLYPDDDEYVYPDKVIYPKVALLGLKGAFIGDNVSNLEPIFAVVRRTVFGPNWQYKLVNNAHANPAYVILYILHNLLDIEYSLIDITSFKDAGYTLWQEKLGVSFQMEDANDATEWIKNVLKHCEGVLYFDKNTGKFTIKLIRNDYNPATIDELSEDDITNIDFQRKSWDDCFTHITYKWRAGRTWEFTSHTLNNPAALEAIGFVRTQTLEFPYITSEDAIKYMITLTQRRYFYPLCSIKFKVSRQVFNPNPGDVFKLTSTELGITGMIFRVTASDGGDGVNQTISIEATEDIWGLGLATIVDIGDTGPSYPPYLDPPVPNAIRIIDSPPELEQLAAIIPMVAKPLTGIANGFCISTDDSDDKMTEGFWYKGTLHAAFPTTRQVDRYSEIIIDGVTGLDDDILKSDKQWQRCELIGILYHSGTNYEIISIKNLEFVSGSQWKITGIIRAQFGTIQAAHAINTELWILNDTLDGFIIEEYGLPDLTLEITSSNPYSESAISTVAYTYGYTEDKPYPPTRLIANRIGNQISITWMPRTRRGNSGQKNIDRIAASNYQSEGYWVITAPDGTERAVQEPAFSIIKADAQEYTIRSVLNGFYSSSIAITV